jgi:hypothetical protein
MYSSPKPGVAAWDDLGVAEVGCHLDTSKPQCLAQLRAEACRMGGDIIYDIPAKPRRPYEQAMVYRARVAHTRTTEGKPEREKEPAKPGEEPPPPATEEESAGPVIPLGTPEPKKKPKPAPPPEAPDGGAPEAPPSRFF